MYTFEERVSYEYNKDGVRTKKAYDGKTHTYTLDGTNIIKEKVTGSNPYTAEYFYDLDGTVCGLKYNGTAYYFYKNLQGDVIAITDDTGATVARYTYDAWGKVLTVKDASGNNITSTAHIANINPFRYRSYYYDTETSLYYLQSRYYNPEVGRFINADELDFQTKIKVAEDNLFAYCINNPVNLNDVSGRWFLNYVAFGFQIELSFGIASFGLEFVITLDLKHIYAYAYGAFSFNKMGSNNLNAIIKDILPNILKKPQSIGKLFKGIAFSVCVFCVWRKWKNKFDPEAYTKGFKGAYATVATPFPLISVKGYVANSSSYFVIGAGASTGGMNVGAVPSYYWDVTPQFNFVMSKIMSMSSKIKRLAQSVD